MNQPNPIPITLSEADGKFLVDVAKRVLGTSGVAATNAQKLEEHECDPKRIDVLIPCTSRAVEWRGFVFKKVEADPEAPSNFGLFVRKRTEAAGGKISVKILENG